MKILDSDYEEIKTEHVVKTNSNNKLFSQDIENVKSNGFSKFIDKFTSNKSFKKIKKQVHDVTKSQIEKNSDNGEAVIENTKTKAKGLITNFKKILSNIALLPVHIVIKAKKVIEKIGENIDQMIHDSNSNITKPNNTVNNKEIFELLQIAQDVPTENTDAMVTYTDEELGLVDNVTNIVQEIMGEALGQESEKTIEFLRHKIIKAVKILKTQRETSINNICDIPNFDRKCLERNLPIPRYIDSLKNMMKHYKSSNEYVVFWQPIQEIKSILLTNADVAQAVLHHVNTNDLWLENLLVEISKYSQEQKHEAKEHIMLFQVIACVLASTHLAMYGVIQEKDTKAYAHKFIQSLN